MTVTTSDADWARIIAEHEQHIAELYELRKLRDAHDAQWRALSTKAAVSARDTALWRSQFEDAQRMLMQLRVELGRERGLRVNAVAACKTAWNVLTLAEIDVSPAIGRAIGDACAELERAIAEAERHG